MSNSKTTRQENLNKYADMLHRQNVSGGQPKPGEVKITKPFEQEKEIKMEQEVVKTNEEIQEELSSSVLRECYILVREKIWDKLSDEERAVITEEYSEEAATAIRAYTFKLSEDEMKELFSETLKEAVNGELFNITSDLLAKAEAEQQAINDEEKVDLMEAALESIKAKAEAVEEKIEEKVSESKPETESTEKVEEVESVEEVVEKTVEEVTDVTGEVKEEKTESEQDSEITTSGEEEVSPESKGFIWPMGKFNEMFPN